jgi:hypothetical protein
MMFNETEFAATAVLALATSAISMSFTQGSMFEPLRSWIARQNALLGELARCFFCLSHWIAFAGVAVYQPRPVQIWWLADLAVAAFVVIALATLISGMMFAGFFMAVQTHRAREAMARDPVKVAH